MEKHDQSVTELLVLYYSLNNSTTTPEKKQPLARNIQEKNLLKSFQKDINEFTPQGL